MLLELYENLLKSLNPKAAASDPETFLAGGLDSATAECACVFPVSLHDKHAALQVRHLSAPNFVWWEDDLRLEWRSLQITSDLKAL